MNTVELYAESVLVGQQWQQHKRISINQQGIITAITDGPAQADDHQVKILIPGMVNCHSHAFQRAFAGLSEYRSTQADSFWSWRDIMYRFVAKMSPDDVHSVARYLYLEMLKAGYTSVAEFHYLHHQSNGEPYQNPAEMAQQVIEAAKQAGIAITMLPVFYHYAGFGEIQPNAAQGRFTHSLDDFCRLWDTLHSTVKNDKLTGLGVAPHSLRAVSHEQLSLLLPFVRDKDSKAPIHIHIAEQPQEVDDCIRHYGQRPVEWLMQSSTSCGCFFSLRK